MFNLFSKTLVVGGIELQRLPENDDELMDLSVKLAEKLAQVLRTEEDVWWFVAEQYDQAQTYGGRAKRLVEGLPIHLKKVEYEGRRSQNSYVGKPNPGIVFLDRDVSAFFEKHFEKAMAEVMLIAIFGSLLDNIKASIQSIRLKFAVHFHNNCVSSHSYNFADQWNEVIQELGGDYR
jgi:hypothetical protein